jgi:hypothetical protein
MNELKNVFSTQEVKIVVVIPFIVLFTFHSLIYSTETTNNIEIYCLSTYNKLGLQKME